MPVTYTFAYNGQSASISKKAAQILDAAILALTSYDDDALNVLDGKVSGIPPLIGPCQAGALIIRDKVSRNKSVALMIKPKETKFTLAKPTGAVKADEK